MPQYQTVIFDPSSGSILKVLANQYIANKKHLARIAGTTSWKDLRFLYFNHDLPIDPSKHKVSSLSPNAPPSIVASDGIPLEFQAIIFSRRKALLAGANCLVEFEGGAGDQLMESAAVLSAMAKYLNSTFSIRVASNYIEVLKRVKGLCPVSISYVGQAADKFNLRISNHTQYISDPRGGYYGKSSLYGAWLGLNSISKIAKINLTRSDFQTESIFLDGCHLKDRPYNFLCQFRSGSGHGKSWQHQKVIRLAELLHQHFYSNIFVVGAANEVPAGSPHIVDLTGRTSWWQTLLLVSKMDLVICIDSGVMHFSRSLGVPHITLWGGTNAQVILGEDEAAHDIRLDLPCRDLICYDCQNKTNACMVKINPEMVITNAHLLLDKS